MNKCLKVHISSFLNIAKIRSTSQIESYIGLGGICKMLFLTSEIPEGAYQFQFYPTFSCTEEMADL